MKQPLLLALVQLCSVASCLSVAGQTLTRASNTTVSDNLGLSASGSTVYVTGASFMLDTYDFSQPASPRRLSSISPGTAYPRRTLAGGTKAYVYGFGLGTSSGPSSSDLRVFDMSKPAAPVAGTRLTLGSPDYLFFAADGKLVCIANGPEATLRIYDANLTLLATVATKAGPSGVAINGTTVYLQRYSQLDVYDVTNAAAPAYISTLYASIQLASGNLGFGVSDNKLTVYDLSSPFQPVQRGSVATNGGTLLAASGNIVYTTGLYNPVRQSANLQAFDVSKPDAPKLLATATVSSSAVGLAANGTTVYLADYYNLQAFSLTGVLASSTPAAVASGLYPNPAHGTVTLAQAPAATPAILYDATGRVCLQTTVRADKTIDISPLPAGLYLARVGAAVHRLVVE